jgi:hypothetical protein
MQGECPTCGRTVGIIVVNGQQMAASHRNDREEECEGSEVICGFANSPPTTPSKRRDGLSGLSDLND